MSVCASSRSVRTATSASSRAGAPSSSSRRCVRSCDRPVSSPGAPMRHGPVTGIGVLEVGHILAGPFGGMLLADLGADVIKIEPIDGDLSRQVGSQYIDDHNVYFASLNRNKRSVHLDLTTEAGQAEL